MSNRNNQFNYFIIVIIILGLFLSLLSPAMLKNIYAESGDFSEEVIIDSVEENEAEIYDSDTLDDFIIQNFKAVAVDNGISLMSSGGSYDSSSDGADERFLQNLLRSYTSEFGLAAPVVDSIVFSLIDAAKDKGDIDSSGSIIINGEEFSGSGGHYFGKNDDGDILISDSFFNDLNSEYKNQVVALQGYYLLNCNNLNYGNEWHSDSVVNAYSEKAYERFIELVPDSGNIVCFCSGNDNGYVSFTFISQPYGYVNDYSYNYNSPFYAAYITVYDNGSISNSSYNGGRFIISYNINYIKTFGPCKLFYTQADYLDYKNGISGGSGANYNLYAPTYNPGNITIDNSVVNYITNNPNTNPFVDFTTDLTGDLVEQGLDNGQEILDTVIKSLFNNLADIIDALKSDGGGGSGGGSSGSGADYSSILQQILDAINLTDTDLNEFYDYFVENYSSSQGDSGTDIDLSGLQAKLNSLDENLKALYDLYSENANNEHCPYDFNELETFLDRIWSECRQNQENISEILEFSEDLQSKTAERLNNIYERLGQLPDYNSILIQILNRLDNLTITSDSDSEENDILEEIRNLLEENNQQNDEVLGKMDDIIKEIQSSDSEHELQDAAESTVQTMQGKFPFCIPFDLVNFFDAISAEPVTPVITVPIVVESINVREEFIIDLHPFDPVIEKFRVIFVALFAIGLMIFTLKYIFKDD